MSLLPQKPNNQADWLPSYSVRHSQRAKHLQMRITAQKGLEVIVPARRRNIDIEAFVVSQREWIAQHADKLTQRENRRLPDVIELPAIGQRWFCQYQTSSGPARLKVRPQQHLQINCAADDFASAQPLLLRWLSRLARHELLPQLQTLSSQCQLPFASGSIRSQATCWGSCTSRGNIQLNRQLLFMPPAVARYVMIHELCHTRFMNHSAEFWQLLAQWDEHYREHKAVLKTAEKIIPAWYW